MSAVHDVEDRLHSLQAVTDTALAHMDLDTLLRELLERVRELLDIDAAVLLLHEPSAGQLVVSAAAGLEQQVHHGIRVPVGEGLAGRVAAEKRAIVLDRIDSTNVRNPLLLESGLRVLVGAPMLAHGQLVGALQVGSRVEREFTDHDLHLLQVAADRIGLATQARVSHDERVAATTLQRSLLPPRLPTLPGMRFAGRYVAGARMGVGGDWYDVFPLPDGRLGIVMGDVSGHGLPAAEVMGRLRSALRAYALDSDDPAEVLDKLNRKAIHFETNAMTTVAYAIVDPETSRLQLSLAGHLPPVLAVPDQESRFVQVPVDPPIGVTPIEHRRCESIQLASDAALCFYTDGLIERRDRPLDDGLEQLRAALKVGPVEQMCGEIMSACLDGELAEDDVAILVMRYQAGAENEDPQSR